MKALCRRYGVTRGGYYAWCSRPISVRAREDELLAVRIEAIFEASEGTYGSPRIHEALRQAGVRVGGKRVARLMREAGLKGDRHGSTVACLGPAGSSATFPTGCWRSRRRQWVRCGLET